MDNLLDKEVSELQGTIEEALSKFSVLSSRLDFVMTPPHPCAEDATPIKNAEASPVVERIRHLQHIVLVIISNIEDVSNRLDI